MALRMKMSKFRHVYGVQCRREQTFENVRITRNTHDSNFCSVNPRFLAIVTESSGGGSFVVLDVNRPGRVDVNCPRVCGHEGAVMDIKWNPFDDCVIASGSDDATVKIWTVPETGLFGTLTDWSADLHGHTRRVGYVEWHTTASNILMSVGFDFKIMIWNVEQAEPITLLDCHNDTIFSVSWGHDGSLIASTSKDKHIRIMDPRSAKVALKTSGHDSAKTSKISFVADNYVFTTGFSRTSDRQYALWDIRKAGTPVVIEDLDLSSGILLPYYDPDTKVIYLAGKGDGNIRYFEVDEGSVQFLNTFQSNQPQRGLGMMPKRGVDPFKNEVARFYKLHASKNLVEPVSMIIPRKAEGFQPDVFPPTASLIASLTADEWTSGINRGPILVDLQTGAILDKPRSSVSPAVLAQNAALSKPPQITTCKAVNRAPPSSFNTPPASFSPAPFMKQISPSNVRTSPEGHAQMFVSSPSSQRLSGSHFGSVEGRGQEPASIKNIKCLSMGLEGSDLSHIPSQTSAPTGLGRPMRSPGSPLSFISPPPPPSTPSQHHVNGFGGISTDEQLQLAAGDTNNKIPPTITDVGYQGDLKPNVQPHFKVTDVRPWLHTSDVQPWLHTSDVQPWLHTSDMQPWSTTTSGVQTYSGTADFQPKYGTDLQPRVSTGLQARTGDDLQPNIGYGLHTQIDTELQPRIGDDFQPKFSTSDLQPVTGTDLQPKFGTNDLQPRSGTDLQSRSGTDLQPRYGPDLQSRGGSDLQPRYGTDLQPKFGTTDLQPKSGTDLQPKCGTDLQSRGGTDLQPRYGTDLQQRSGTDLQPWSGTDLHPRSGIDLQSMYGTDIQPKFDLSSKISPFTDFTDTDGEVNPSKSSAAATSHTNTFHVRKVWAPPVQSSLSVFNVTAPHHSGQTSPRGDVELKKAYFRQLEEIRSLQEQLELKDRRIKQLEMELSHFKDQNRDMNPRESNC